MVAPVLRRSRRRASGRMTAAAVAYAALGWPVVLGAYPRGNARSAGRACSCDRVGCPAPAAHPLSPAWQMQATSDPGKARQQWAHHPEANVILPTGRVFDVLDVPAAAGLAALEMMHDAGVATGPVATGSGRTLFFVATRGAPDNEDEWWSCHLDCAPEEISLTVMSVDDSGRAAQDVGASGCGHHLVYEKIRRNGAEIWVANGAGTRL